MCMLACMGRLLRSEAQLTASRHLEAGKGIKQSTVQHPACSCTSIRLPLHNQSQCPPRFLLRLVGVHCMLALAHSHSSMPGCSSVGAPAGGDYQLCR